MNRLHQAMFINDLIDELYSTDEAVTTIDQFNVIYDALEEIDELIESEELDEDLDDEEEIELRNYTSWPEERYVETDIEEDFNEFSPSVGTLEGTETLQQIVGRETAHYSEPMDFIKHSDGSYTVQPSRLSEPVGGYNQRVNRAPVDERVESYSDGNFVSPAKSDWYSVFEPASGCK